MMFHSKFKPSFLVDLVLLVAFFSFSGCSSLFVDPDGTNPHQRPPMSLEEADARHKMAEVKFRGRGGSLFSGPSLGGSCLTDSQCTLKGSCSQGRCQGYRYQKSYNFDSQCSIRGLCMLRTPVGASRAVRLCRYNGFH